MLRPQVAEAARECRGHSRGRQAVGFEAVLPLVRRGGIEMQADEQIGVMRLREGDAIGQGNVRIIGAREENRPAVRGQQGFDAPRPIEREFLFKASVHQAVCADIDAAVAGVEHEHAAGAERGRFAQQQRLQIFLQVEAVDKNLVVNDFRREAEVHFQPAPDRLPAANFQNHRAPGRGDGVAGHRQTGQLARRRDFILRRPAVERSPRQDGRGPGNF